MDLLDNMVSVYLSFAGGWEQPLRYNSVLSVSVMCIEYNWES